MIEGVCFGYHIYLKRQRDPPNMINRINTIKAKTKGIGRNQRNSRSKQVSSKTEKRR